MPAGRCALGFAAASFCKRLFLTQPTQPTQPPENPTSARAQLSFSESARRSHPTNLILLTGFTLAEAVVVGAITAQYNTDVVLLALGITAAVSAGLTAYALQTKVDFTTAGGVLFSVLLTLCMTAFAAALFPTSGLRLAVACGGALLFSAYIVHDVQLVASGQHEVRLSPDEYVPAAINIYLDVINLFLHLLQLLRAVERD